MAKIKSQMGYTSKSNVEGAGEVETRACHVMGLTQEVTYDYTRGDRFNLYLQILNWSVRKGAGKIKKKPYGIHKYDLLSL